MLRLRDKLQKENRRQRRAYFEEAYQLYRDLLSPAAEALRWQKPAPDRPGRALCLPPL